MGRVGQVWVTLGSVPPSLSLTKVKCGVPDLYSAGKIIQEGSVRKEITIPERPFRRD